MIEPLPFILYDLGYEIRRNEHYDYNNNNRGNYSGYLIQYTFNGQGMFESNGIEYPQSADSGFIVQIPDNSRYYLPTDSNGWDYFYIHFNGILAEQFYNEIYSATGNTFSLPITNPAIQLFIEEYNALEHGKRYKRFEAGTFVYSFLTTLLRELQSPESTEGFVYDAVNWINSNYASNQSLQELSVMLGISQAHLSRAFRAKTGLAPIEYLTNVRLEHSMHLLTTTSLTIGEIAVQCGFDNGNYFSKVFRHKLKVSPSQYRKSH